MNTTIRTCGLPLITLVITFAAPVIAAGGLRTRPCPLDSAASIGSWQPEVRDALFEGLHLTDLVKAPGAIPLDVETLKEEARDGFTLLTIEFQSTATRRMQAQLALPDGAAAAPRPAVVAIHGHGGNLTSPFTSESPAYKEFGSALARKGFVVISTSVGQHEVYEAGRTLMGERLWDLMRCVDLLASRPEVDPERLGCGGLSLGGEMAMWLGGMDPRMRATVSAGFLTYMDHMEQNHCMCWKFDGLRDLVDFPDVYALTAPRALQCQNGLQEPETQFNVPLARQAMTEIQPAYNALDAGDRVDLHVHGGGHEIDLDALVDFLEKHL